MPACVSSGFFQEHPNVPTGIAPINQGDTAMSKAVLHTLGGLFGTDPTELHTSVASFAVDVWQFCILAIAVS